MASREGHRCPSTADQPKLTLVCEQHPHCLAGAGEGKGEGDLFGREAEAAEVDGGVLGDWVDYFLQRLVRVVMEGRSDGRNIPAV